MQTEFTLSLVALCGQNVSLGCGIHYSYAALAALRIGNNLKEGKIATVVQHSTAQHSTQRGAQRGAQRIRIPQLHLPAVRTHYLTPLSPPLFLHSLFVSRSVCYLCFYIWLRFLMRDTRRVALLRTTLALRACLS